MLNIVVTECFVLFVCLAVVSLCFNYLDIWPNLDFGCYGSMVKLHAHIAPLCVSEVLTNPSLSFCALKLPDLCF